MKSDVIKALETVLAELDSILSGKSNIIYKTDLNELRNKIVDLQDEA
jgi:hypothetical protein